MIKMLLVLYPGCQRSSRSPAARSVRASFVVLVSERPLAQAVKSFESADPITLPFISPESKYDPGNLIGRLKKRFLKGLLLVKCAMILAKPVLLKCENKRLRMADVNQRKLASAWK